MKKWLAGAALCTGLMSVPQTMNKTEASNKLYFPRACTEEVTKKTKDDILFTIDDGPSKYMLEIAKTLDSVNYQGIFYVVTRGIKESTRKDLVEVIKMGHHIGNHSYSHPNFQILTIDQAKQQILTGDSIIASLYQEADVAQEKKYIRFPYGNNPPSAYREEFNNFLDSLGYEPAMFRRMDTDLKDRKSEPSAQKIDKMKLGDTILLHERSWTVETIKCIVASIDEKTDTSAAHQ